MSAIPNKLFGRRCSLLVANETDALDLSEMHIRFETSQEDEESPNNAKIRVYNLTDETIVKLQTEFNKVVLQAGYWGAPFGIIFSGTIKQFRVGKENSVTKYLDILAADGDLGYNWAVVNHTLAAGSTPMQRVQAAVNAMAPKGVTAGQITLDSTGGILPRGKVLFGLARDSIRQQVVPTGHTWNIQDGKVVVTPLTGYQPGEAVVLTAATGLVGIPERTQQGIKARCLINPRIRVGSMVKIDNKTLNQTFAQGDAAIPGAQIPYNRYAGVEMYANTSTDGVYRVYVAEYKGDTRGQEWYCDLILLSIDPVTQQVKAF
jgi:hypothetical protein